MNRSTAEWEALTERITGGPWEWDDHRVPTLSGTYTSSEGTYTFQDAVLEADHDGGCGCRSACDLELNISEPDKKMIAVAPEAVAEVIRLRRELEELRSEMKRNARLSSAFGSSGYIEIKIATRITRILNPKEES